jgi:hypothetical protein
VTRLALLFAIGLLPGVADAAEFVPHRGLSLETWQDWPAEERWDERDVMLPYPQWQGHLGPADFKALKDAGLDFLRIPIDPAPLLSDRARALHGDLVDSVVAAVDTVNAAGLKALVDLHSIPSDSRTVNARNILEDDARFAAYAELVAEIADRLSGEDPSKVAIELMNEPVTGCEGKDADGWQQQALALHAAARAAAPKLTLVLSGACWGSAEGLAALDPATFADANLIWSFHSYDPFLLTHQGAGWAGDFIPYVTGLPYPLYSVPRAELDAAVERIRDRIRAQAPLTRRPGMLAYLDEQVAALDTSEELQVAMTAPFDRVAAWAERNGIAPADILLGEFGMIRQAWEGDYTVPAAERAAYYRDMIALAENHGFAWSMWSYGSDFGIVEAFGGEPAEGLVMDAIRALPHP